MRHAHAASSFRFIGSPRQKRNSLARPGGNITGVTVNAAAHVGKRLELLRELVPKLRQVAVLTHPGHPTDPVQRKELEEAARGLGLQLKPVAVRGPDDFEAAFKAVSGADGLINIDTPLFATHRERFAELAAKSRLPAIWANRTVVEAGGLMSYGTYIPALFRRAAIYVDKVLKGSKPRPGKSSSGTRNGRTSRCCPARPGSGRSGVSTTRPCPENGKATAPPVSGCSGGSSTAPRRISNCFRRFRSPRMTIGGRR